MAAPIIAPSPTAPLTLIELQALMEKRMSALEAKLAALAAKSGAKVLGIADLEARIGVDRSTIFRWVKAGKLPAPSYFGSRRVWPIEEVKAWEDAQVAKPHVKVPRGIAKEKARGGRPCSRG